MGGRRSGLPLVRGGHRLLLSIILHENAHRSFSAWLDVGPQYLWKQNTDAGFQLTR